MKRNLIITIVVLVILSSGYIFFQSSFADFIGGKAFLLITTNASTTVSLNDKVVGTTPYSAKDLPVKDYLVKLVSDVLIATSAPSATPSATKITWESNIRVTPNTQTVINQEIGPLSIFSSGEILSLEKGTGLTVITKPEEVKVNLDGNDLSVSPISASATVGNHKLKLSKTGYFSREITVNVPNGFRLIINAQLALNPLESEQKAEGNEKVTLYRFSTDNFTLLDDPQSWASGIWFFQEKYASASPRFDLILDSNGKGYYSSSTDWAKKQSEKKAVIIGYLSKTTESGLSEAAKKKYEEIKNSFYPIAKVKISSTPTGWLNVRGGASQSNSIITKVNPGEIYELLEEKTGWYKIKLSDGKEGWISSQYATKI
ncbi:MAG: SH3 domain-containing protein [Patescibacteria group bacterium]|nr:SH3 domain-containing protein [Patescibacteria group bacterium]